MMTMNRTWTRHLKPEGYLKPLARDEMAWSCPCGRKSSMWDLQLCGDCLKRAATLHRNRLAALADRISYDDADLDVRWSLDDPGISPLSLPFRAPDVYAPDGGVREFLWAGFPDDEILAAALSGASSDELLALMVTLLHFSLVSVAAHEVGEWFTVHGARPFDPHKLDKVLLIEGGEDGLGALSLDMRYQHAPRPPGGARLEPELAAELSSAVRFRDGIAVAARSGRLVVHKHRAQGNPEVVLSRELPRPRWPQTLSWDDAVRAVHQALVEDAADRVAEQLCVDGTRVFAPCNSHSRGLVPVHLDVVYEEA